MKDGKRQQPGHENRHEARIVRAVEAVHVTDEQKPFYVMFARELDLTLRRGRWERVIPSERSDSRNLAARRNGRDPSTAVGVTEGRDPSQELGVTTSRDPSQELGVTDSAPVRARPFPDYSMRTKRLVMKYFARGLSGHKMWLIGEALLGDRREEWR